MNFAAVPSRGDGGRNMKYPTQYEALNRVMPAPSPIE